MEVTKGNKNITIQYEQPLRPYHTILAELVLKYKKKEHSQILDIGCGVGHTLVEIAKEDTNCEFVIADLDSKCLEITSERVNVTKSILFDQPQDIYSIEKKFDVIIISHTLHYDPAPHATMQKLLGLLNEDGFILLAIPNAVTPNNLLNHLRKRHLSQGLYFWDMPTFKNFLERGLNVNLVEIKPDYVPLPFIHMHKVFYGLSKKMTRLFPWLSFSLIAVLKNKQ